jgi:hypothetical protein
MELKQIKTKAAVFETEEQVREDACHEASLYFDSSAALPRQQWHAI